MTEKGNKRGALEFKIFTNFREGVTYLTYKELKLTGLYRSRAATANMEQKTMWKR